MIQWLGALFAPGRKGGAHTNRQRAVTMPVLALLLFAGAALAPLQTVLSPSPAEAVDLPPVAVNDLFIQTSGPNASLADGDWYTAAGGGGQDHLIEITVPSGWPGLPVTVALFDPELETPDPAGPVAVDQIRGTADSATFTVLDPGGATIATQTYASGGGTNGQWTELVTFTPATSGTYQLSATTSDDDDNSWRVRVNNDPDCSTGCSPSELDDGDEVDDPDGIPGTGDELLLGIQRASYQHAVPGTVCNDFYFFVDGSSSNVTLHNFDMDGAGSVTYLPPDGSTVNGTVSGNQVWNNSASSVRVGDTVPVTSARIGWWRTTVCIPTDNQYIFEGVDGEPVYIDEAPPVPSLTLTKDDGTSSVEIGDTITYQLDFTNPSDATSTPGSAESIVLFDTLPSGVSLQSCSFGVGLTGSCTESSGLVTAVVDQGIPAGGNGSVSIVANVVSPTGSSITNNAQILWQDIYGNTYPSVSASDTDAITGTDLAVFKTVDNAVPWVGETVTFTVTVAHQAGDPATGVEVTDLLPIGFSYQSHSVSAGSYTPGTGLWTVGDLAAGGSESMTLVATVIGTSGVYNVAELTAVDQVDPDSIPANSNTTEDDYALVDIAVGGGDTLCWLVADDGRPFTSGEDLLTLHNSTGEVEIGTGTGTFSIESIAFQPSTEVLYAADGGQFGSIDTGTGLFTPIGPGGLGDIDGMAFDLVTLRLYGADRVAGNDELVEIDPATGTIVPGAFSGSDRLVMDTISAMGGGDIDDFAIDPTDNGLYAIANDGGTNNHLVIVDRTTGAVTLVGPTAPVEDIEGLGFDNFGNLYAVTGSAEFFELDKATGQSIPGSGHSLAYGDYESIDCDTNGSNTISGTVYLDKDANALFDGSDSGTDGVTVRVWRDINGSGTVDVGDSLVGQQTTSSGGGYLFTTGASGEFLIDVDQTTLPPGATFTTDNYEDADFGASFGLADSNNDFGYTLPSSLEVAKTSDATAATQPGDQINYTITVTNPGSTIQTGVVVTDPLPVGTSYVPGSTTGTWFEPSPAPTISEDWETTDDDWIGGTGWVTDRWTEVGETGGSNGGDIRIENENGSVAVRIQDNDNGGEGVERSADLSGWASATLTYDFDRDLNDSDDYVMVLVSTDGSPFTEIERYSGPANDSGFQPASLDLTPYMGADTLIRFLTGPTTGGGERVYFDNIAITGEILTPVVKSNATGALDPLDDGVPADLVTVADGAIVPPGGTVTVTYSVIVDDPAPATSVVNTVTASSNQSSPDTATVIDPLNVASIADFVWDDLDADGVQDPGEPGLAGVTVELLDGGVVTRTTTTASDGSYRLAWLSGGSYEVRFTAPAGYLFSPADSGSDDAVDSDAIPATGVTSTIALAAGQTLTTVDAGLYQLATLGDLVWDDLDADGLQDAGEPGLGGITVELLDGLGVVIDTTTTASDGSYGFSVVPGTYSVRVVYPVDGVGSPADQGGDDANDSDADPATGETGSITLTSGQTYDGLDVGVYTRGTLGDYVFDDLNGNGIQDSGETGISGVTVELLDSGGAVVDTATTGGAGDYSFTDIEPGDYSVRFTTPSGYRASPADSGGDDALDSDPSPSTGETGTITVVSGTNDNSIDAGFYVPVRLGDLVFVDADSDGIQDPGELGAAGFTVNLLDGSNSVIATTTTASDGTYGFADLDPGLYRVEVLAPGFSFTSRDQGADDTIDSDVSTFNGRATVILSGGGDDDTIDAGILPAILGDFVWEDLNGNGVQDSGEPGIGGVTVNLLNAGGVVITTTTTAADGSYSFAVGPGTYEIEFVAPPGTVFTVSGSGTPGTDSNANPATGRTGAVVVADDSGDLTLDAGLYTPVDLGDRVWDDLNADGLQDAGEAGLAGVTVQLRNSSNVVIATTTTDASGVYAFTDLVPGDYSVTFAPPAGYQISAANVGADDTLDSDPAPGSGTTGTITLVSGIDDSSVDAGMYRLGSIGDRVWVDLDSDGIQDAGEPGLAGVTVNVLDAGSMIVGSAITAADGSYVVDDLTPGDYTVEFVAPGYTFTAQDVGADDAVDSDPDSSGTTGPVTVVSGAAVNSVDAGVEPIVLGDFAFVDTDGDGVQDSGEPGLGGVTVELLVGGSVTQTTATAADGSYSFDVAPGTYEVRFTAPGAYQITAQDQGGDDSVDSDIDQTTGTTASFSVPGPADNITIDAGFFLPASVSDYVWDDLDADGIQDLGEPGISGVTVELRDAGGTLVSTTTTAAGGLYSFTGLTPGDYTLTFVSPAGAAPTTTDAGSDDSVDSDIDAAGSVSTNLVSDENETSIDAGFVTPAAIGDLVWDDLNGDGVRDLGEPGLAGVPIDLLDGSGAVVASTTSAVDGSYSFTSIAPGSYRVRFGTVGASYITDQDQGGDDSSDSDADPNTGETALFTLISGQSDLTLDAGLVAPASLGDTVWFDADSNGVQDLGEPGVAGLVVELLDGSNAVVATDTTDASGAYGFTGLEPGDYSIRVVGAGLVFAPQDQGADDASDSDVNGAGVSSSVTLISGDANETVDAGVIPSSIGDRVFVDLDGDGQAEPGDPGLSGVTIELLDGVGAVVASTTSAGDGSYLFDYLLPGDYQVRFTAPAGYDFTAQDAVGDAVDSDADAAGLTALITLAGGVDNATVDAGLFQTAAIGDFVWDDLDGDGVQDVGEPGLDGVTVELRDNIGTLLATTTTSGGGSYSFTGLTPGSYTVTFILSGSETPTSANVGGDDGIDSDIDGLGSVSLTLTSNQNDSSIDAGFYTPATIGDFVWDDLDGNGVQGVAEPGFGGVLVDLLDGSGSVVSSTTTAGDGSYSFTNVPPGDYRVRFTPSGVYGLTAADQGADDTIDSDPDVVTGETSTFTVISGDAITSVDAGLIAGASIGDFFWFDEDGDGVQDPTEPGVPGITVELLNGAGTVVGSTVTLADGSYSFGGLAPGDYSVRVPGAGLVFTSQGIGGDPDLDSDVNPSGQTGSITLTSGLVVTDLDVGILPSSIGDFVWEDTNGNGVQDGGEPGLPGVTVELLNSGGAVIATDTTTAAGAYLFDLLVPGTYSIQVSAPAGYVFTSSDSGANDSLDSDTDGLGTTTPQALAGNTVDDSIDAGLYRPVAIGNFVWDDLDGDGVQDGGEPGIDGVTVELRNGAGTLVGTTTTSLGFYSFAGLVPGDYTLSFVGPAGSAPTVTDVGADDSVDSDINAAGSLSVSLPSGTNDMTLDAGFVTPATIGDFVWDDLDGDGVQDLLEPGLIGVPVELLDSSGTVLVSTTSAADGSYGFAGVAPGTYSVRFGTTGAYELTGQDQTGNDLFDSDADPLTGETAQFTVASGENQNTIDAGLVAPASLGDRIWFDDDSDGIQDVGEPGVPGLSIELLDVVGAVLETTTTAADGSYSFTDLAPGDYSIQIVGTGLVYTGQNTGADDSIDSDVDAGGRSDTATLISGQNDSTIDGGILPSTIGDFVFVDTDGDGIQDAGEPGLNSVTVELLDDGGAVIGTTSTAADGSYSFDRLLPGDYQVRFTAPVGYEFTGQDVGGDDSIDSDASAAGLTATISLPGNTDIATVDTGLFELGSIGDFVWDDLDGDGVQDSGEPGISGVAVELRDGTGTFIGSTTTAADGSYSFTNLDPDDYSLIFTAPVGAAPTAVDSGGDLVDSDVDASGSVSVSIITGEDNNSIDAGYVTPASVGDFVWDDLDGNGIQDAGEPGIGGVTIELLDNIGTVVASTSTAADGSYAFVGLAPGQYQIRAIAPVGTGFSAIDIGGDDDLDSDVDPVTGESAPFTLVSGQVVTNLDAGLITPATIGDVVWYDLDADGIQDAGEPGAAGIVVTLTTSGGTVIAGTTTDASGNYGFSGLAPGDYLILVDPTLTFTAQDSGGDDAVDSDVDGSGVSTVVTLISGENDDTVDAGVLPPAVGDFVWTDVNGDGIQDPGEPGLGGVTVELLDGGGSVVGTTVSAADGSYLFGAVVPGSYTLRFTAPPGFEFTGQDAGGDDAVDSDADPSGVTAAIVVTPTIGTLTVDAGLYQLASLGDFVWDDLNADGVQDPGEPGLSGVAVELRTAGGALVSTTTTAGDGSYSFTGLVPGDYAVTVLAPAGYAATVANAGGDDATDSDVNAIGVVAVTLSSNENDDTVDAGFVTPASVGNFVWDDLDGDGVQDAGEPGIAGATVELIATDGTVLATTASAADGSYAFTGVAPGTYRVRFTPPGSYDFSPADAGGDDSLDSDPNPTSGESANFTVASGEVNDTIDAGVLNGASIGDLVWIDADGDGVQDAGEPAAPGLTVELLDSGGAVVATTTTAADGSYQFGGLLPGTYTVRLPDSDLVFTGQDVGPDDSIDSDVDSSGVSDPITIISGQSVTSLDAGVLPSSIGDFVWSDTDADGLQDAGELGLGGVVVELLNGSGTVITSTTTAADGSYLFDLLLPGDYQVRFTAPVGYSVSPQDAGADDSVDSDADAIGRTAVFSLAGNSDDDTIDTGMYELATLGDRVWIDLDGDGIQSPGEPGVGGLTVNLLDDGGTVVATDTTDATGIYQFVGIVPGFYSVAIIAPGFSFVPADTGGDDTVDSDVTPATGETPTIVISSGESNLTIDAGVEPATIGDFVWDDLDGNGVQDSGEPGIGGVAVNLLDGVGAALDSTTTAADGSYSFAVAPGTYEVEFVAPLGSAFSAADQGSDDVADSDADPSTGRTGTVTVTGSGSNTTLDAGLIAPASIGDTIFQDYNGDGIEDAGDTGLDGITVNLLDGAGTVIDTAVTAGGGQYNFTGLEPGTYRVDIVDSSVPGGYVLTTSDPVVVTVVSAQSYLDADFGYQPTGSVEIIKNPGTQAVVTGGTATFTITVTNTGTSTITNVTVSDPLAPDCDQIVGTLAAGASTTYSCTLTGVTAPFSNTATVDADGPGGIVLTDSDTADVTVEQPGITITKSPANQTVVTGGTASFTIAVTNTGETALSNVTVSDPAAPLCNNPIGALAVGETVSYTCDLSPVSVDFTNTATVSGDDPIGNPVSASDSADVDVIAPGIQLIKNPASQSVVPNGIASFVITVTNIGDAPLTNVVVSDPLAPDCDTTVGGLGIGQTETINCSVSGITSGFTNTAVAVGEDPTGSTVTDDDTAEVLLLAPSVGITKDPANQTIITGSDANFTITVVNNGDAAISNVTVTDPQAPNCDNSIGTLAVGASVTYNCDLAGVGADFTNTATVDAEDSGGNPLTATDSADVDVIAPSIEIVKDPAAQSIVTGNTATFSITVTNTGDADLTNVAVTDPLAPACDQFIGNLIVGGSTTYSCDLATVTSSLVNVASVSGEDPTGGPVNDSDTAQVTVLTPSIEITKNPADQQVLLGEDASFSITVTNTGDANLAAVAVTDPQAPGCDNVIGDLPVGAAVTYTCVLNNVTADFTNTATVDATDPQGGPVTDSDNANVDVINPGISIVKDPASQSILTGTDASFTITVTNTGDVALTGVTVTDGPVPSCDNTIGDMTIGAVVTYSCVQANVTADFTNTAQVTGTDPIAGTVTDSDDADVAVLVPGINIVKTTSTPQVVLGGTASFDITVTNTGTAPLTNVQVADPLAPDCDRIIGSMAAGEAVSYTCSLTGLIGDITNQATVTGDDSSGTEISDSDTEPVDVISPEILIAKTPNDQTVIVNGTATFSITVTNVGDVPLTGVTVSDPVAPDCDRSLGDLAASSSVSYNCTLDNVAADFTNTAIATGTHPVSGPVQSTDTANVMILTPGISITKTAVDSVIRSGSDAMFDIIVSNSGQTDLTNVEVTDPLAPGCDNTIGALPLGGVVSYSCVLTSVTADFVNTASVSASDAVGNVVRDDDSAPITVIDPTIQIEKTPELQQLLAGETATFTITVTNPGDVTLTAVAVTDPLAPDCDRSLADLTAGASESYTCSLTNVVGDFTNVATVDATDPLGDPVTASDDAQIDVVNPGIDIEKTPDAQTILSGDTATFTITVTNDGDQDIADAAISDPSAPDCDNPSTGPLAVGASISYSCDSAALTADLVNIASVDGTDVLGNTVSDSDDAAVRVISPAIDIDKTPDAQAVVAGGTANFTITVANSGDADLVNVTVSDPLAPSCDAVIGALPAGSSTSYNCSLAPVPADFTNTASVTGDDELANQHTASDTADVTVLTPALDVTKDPGLQIVNIGDDATFTISITNSGQTPLTNVAVTDAQSPTCDNVIGALAVGQTITYSCVASGVTADFVNTASATGDDPLGRTVTDEDSALVDVIAPAIDIEKTPDVQNILAGNDASFTITVTNIGDSDLTAVGVADAATPTCDRAIGDLAVGDAVTYTCTATAVTSTFTNVADVVGTDPGGNPVTDSDDAVVDVTQIGSITGIVFLDGEADGVFNNADVLLAGVPVDLIDGAGTVVATVLTDGSGEYRFIDVPVGDYTVDVFGDDPNIPAGSLLTTANDPQSASVVANTETRATDTGYAPPSTLSGRAFTDDNADGVDAAEPGIGAVTVTVWRDTTGNGVPDTVVATTPTASDGTWLVDGLSAGTYSVEYATPAGLQPTFADLGGDDTVDSDIDPNTGFTPTVALGTGDSIADLDAGYFTPGSIGDLVFADPNANAVQDVGEVGLSGIEIVATWAGPDGVFATADDQIYSQTTAAGGSYLIGGLPGGRYSVEILEPVGSVVTTGNDPVQITIAPGGTDLDADFGLDGSGVISGTVYSDLNNDGIRDGAEPGIQGVTLELTGTDVNGIPVSLSTTTDSNGDYSFASLDGGTYTIAEVQPSGFLDGLDSLGSAGGDGSVNDVASSINLPLNGTGFAYDFGEIAPSSISGLVQTVGGNPISDVTLTLTGTDDLGAAVSEITVTAVDGSYSFGALRPGDYTVTETQPVGYGEGGELAGSEGGTASLNEILGIVLVPGTSATGYIFSETTGSLSGTVYNDQDGSGSFNPGDTGIGGVELTLSGADINGPVSVTTTSAADGTYRFDGLLPGTYDIVEAQPAVYADAAETVGTLGGDASANDVIAAIPVQAGEVGTDYNFGESGIEITGRVFLDRDANGVEDGADSPLGGVVIVLLDSAGTQIAAASTAADGSYQFTELSAGDYTVQQIQPPEWGSSTPNEISFTLSNTGRSGLDFGETPGSISGAVFADDENDGISSGDLAIQNVEVTLLDSSGTTVATTLTAADGTYRFDGLPAAGYTVVISPPAGSTFSPANVGVDDLIDSDVDRQSGSVTVVVDPGQNRTDVDAGITPIVYDVAVTVTVASGSYRPNDQIPFTVAASNNSNVPLAGGVVVTIPLPAGTNLISAVGDGWTITQSGTVLTARFDGDLAIGQSAPPITVTLAHPTPGTVLLPATIAIADSALIDTIQPNNAADAVVTVDAPPAIPVPSLPVTGVTTALLLAIGGFFVFSGRGLMFFAGRRRDDDEAETDG